MSRISKFAIAGAAVIAALAGSALAQTGAYPQKPIRVIVPFAPGGTSDAVWRIVAPKLSEMIGQPVLIDNRPGAGSTLGARLLMNTPADGYTFLGTANVHVLSSNVYQGLPYHPTNDFAPIAQLAEVCTILVVHPSLPVTTTKELIALAKTNPNKVDFATTGVGTGQHMFMMLLMSMTGMQLHHVPYKGVAQSLPDLVAGRVQVKMAGASILLPYVNDKRVRAIAVSSAQRSQFLPNVPSLNESGVKGYEASLREGAIAKKGTPPEVIAKLSSELLKVMRSPDVQKSILAGGSEPNYLPPDKWSALLNAENEKWSKLVKELGIKVE